MTLKSFLFRKKMERHLPKSESVSNRTLGGLKGYLRTSYCLYIKPQLEKVYNRLKFINRIPFPVLLGFYLIFVIIAFSIFSKIEFNSWVQAISIMYPESVTGQINAETGQLMPSPLDSVMIPYNAKVIGSFWIMFHLAIVSFLGITWKIHNDGSPQSFQFRRKLR